MQQPEYQLFHKYYLPTFLGLGSQRCASTYLQRCLEIHPEITLIPKECRFFSSKIRTESIDSYSQLFQKAGKHKKNGVTSTRGEIDPSYATLRLAEIAIVKELIPDLKLILIVRNPVDRMISYIGRGWRFHYLDGGNAGSRNLFILLRKVDNKLSCRFTDYFSIYKKWSYLFGKTNIFVETYENLTLNPKQILKKCCLFLEVDSQIENILSEKQLYKHENASSTYYRQEIPHFLKWYLAKKWLPKTRILQSELNLDLSHWIDSMEKTASEGKFQYYLIVLIHYIYFVIPYTIVYNIFNSIRIPLKIFSIRYHLNCQQKQL